MVENGLREKKDKKLTVNGGNLEWWENGRKGSFELDGVCKMQ